VEAAKAAFLDPTNSLGDLQALFGLIIEQAHEAVASLGDSPKTAPRSTIVMLLLREDRADWANVGDSRIYHLRDGEIISRSKDHTMVEILLQQGEITEEEMGTHPDQSRLLRCLGADEDPKPSFGSCDLREGDGFLLCSDGLWERVKRREIEEVFCTAQSENALRRLVGMAVKRNGPKGDNVTALAVQCGEDPSKEKPRNLAVCVLRGIMWGCLLGALLVVLSMSRCNPFQQPAVKSKVNWILSR
jgi:serine/threonine protein phosphatase PrpC